MKAKGPVRLGSNRGAHFLMVIVFMFSILTPTYSSMNESNTPIVLGLCALVGVVIFISMQEEQNDDRAFYQFLADHNCRLTLEDRSPDQSAVTYYEVGKKTKSMTTYQNGSIKRCWVCDDSATYCR